MLYLDEHPERIDISASLSHISAQRREQVLRLRHPQDQRLSLSAYNLLRRALRLEYGIDTPPVFAYTTAGKPTLLYRPDIYFSLSHCPRAAACAVSPRPVGVDVEVLSAYDPLLLPATMSPAEQSHILSHPNPAYAFLRLWTRKESLLKLFGIGLIDDLPNMLEDAALGTQASRLQPSVTIMQPLAGSQQSSAEALQSSTDTPQSIVKNQQSSIESLRSSELNITDNQPISPDSRTAAPSTQPYRIDADVTHFRLHRTLFRFTTTLHRVHPTVASADTYVCTLCETLP